MLVGHYYQKLSGKGRTALPARFRKEQGRDVVLSRWYEGSLSIFNKQEWTRMVSQATRGVSTTAAARDTERFLLGGAYEIELDNQGRFVVPQALREYAKLGQNSVVFVGLGNRVEIWDKKRWEEREKQVMEHAEELIEKARKDE